MCSLFVTARSNAQTVFNVEFNDLDGPHWTGQVDTNTDSLTITTWKENPGGNDFWTPQILPWTWFALNAAGTPVDVRPNWDGTIDGSWGFFPSETSNDLIPWEETATHGPPPDLTGIGWGGMRIEGGIDLTGPQVVHQIPLITKANNVWTSASMANEYSVTIAVPEPSGLYLLLLGAAVASVAWRKRVFRQMRTHT